MGITSASDMVAAAKQQVENLNVDQVADEIDQGALVVDLREADELAQTGRIPGAIHVPRGMLEFRADPASPYHFDELDPSRRVIVHCAAGGRGALAARTLNEMGYENVAHLDGGITAWIGAGRPTEANG